MLFYSHLCSISGTKFLRHEINTKLLTYGIEKVDGLCKLSFSFLSHYICILPLLMYIQALSTSIMNFLIIHFPRGEGGQKVPRGHLPPLPPLPLNETLVSNYCSIDLHRFYMLILQIYFISFQESDEVPSNHSQLERAHSVLHSSMVS